MEVIKNDCKFNTLTHLIFPSRTLAKELIYWPTEIAAAIIVFVYIIQIDTTSVRLYNGIDFQVDTHTVKMTNGNNYGLPAVRRGAVFGISYLDPNMAYHISEYESDLLNREYAWVCLCYIIKHALYFLDFMRLHKRKLSKLYDFITPIMNMWLWIMWGVYGWTKSNEQVHGGMYLRFRKDVIYSRDLSSPSLYSAAVDEYEKVLSVYHQDHGWPWLWIICAIVTVSHTGLWLLSLKQGRSSAFTGLSLSVILIPMQLLILQLFFKGSWIRSNWATLFTDTTSRPKAMYSMMQDYFEARWVFVVIYLAAWAGLIFALLCLAKGAYLLQQKVVPKGLKYLSYTFFWGAAFVWTLLMDSTLYHYYCNVRTALIVFHAIGLFFALILFILSVIEKRQEGEKFFTRHEKWQLWWWSNNCECDNNAERSASHQDQLMKSKHPDYSKSDEKQEIHPAPASLD